MDFYYPASLLEPDSLYAVLSRHFTYFRVDTIDTSDTDLPLDSIDVYFITIRPNTHTFSTSLVNRFREFIYEGGIILVLGDICFWYNGYIGILYDSLGGWLFGIEPCSTIVYDSVNNVLGNPARFIYSFYDHPVLPELDTVVYAGLAGSVITSPPAVTLANTYPTGYAVNCYDSTRITPYPAVLGMSHYGFGTIIYHSDFSSLREYWRYRDANRNLELILGLADCSRYPHFIHSPLEETLIRCFSESFSISTAIYNFGNIDPDSISILWRDSIYTIDSPQLSVYDSSFSFTIPPYSYHDGDTVIICIANLVDIYEYWHYDSACWEYYVEIDEYPPSLSGFVPAPGETLSLLDTISLIATDTSDINLYSIQITILDTSIWWEDPSLWMTGDTLFFNTVLLDFPIFLEDTTILVCLHIQDDNKQCEPTSLDTCWSFILKSGCTDRESPTINILQPAEGETLLILDTIYILASDSSGIDTSSIVFTFLDSIINWGDSCIWIHGDTIYFDPYCAGLNPGWVDTMIIVCVYLEDNLVDCPPNPTDTCWSFYLNSSGIDEVQLPVDFEIKAYPNPFNSKVNIEVTVKEPTRLKISVLDITGRIVATICEQNIKRGKHVFVWDSSNNNGESISSGIYFYNINNKNCGKAVLLK
ncbi:T9SS type A sorting domain-containing protein [bacterium]|nr:T9SS type A sorting domain-containing protein [bacterium]